MDRSKNVTDYKFKAHDRIVFVQQTIGGSGGFSPPRGVKLELTTEPCCVLFDNNPDVLRARMPCSCAISKKDLVILYETLIGLIDWPNVTKCHPSGT